MMDRREFIAQAAIGAVLPCVTTSQGFIECGQTMSAGGAPAASDINAQYETCKIRGHVATIEGNTHSNWAPAVFIATPDRPATSYQQRVEGTWQTCFYCKKQFRFVTTLEEK